MREPVVIRASERPARSLMGSTFFFTLPLAPPEADRLIATMEGVVD